MKALLSILLATTWLSISQAADYYNISDPVMAEYEGFWNAASGAKGRVTAQIRPVSNNKYDGFIVLMRVKSPVAAFRLEPAALENGSIKFSKAAAIEQTGADLLARTEAQCELRGGKLIGKFSGELGEGTFEASVTEKHPPSLGAKPPKHAVVLLGSDSTNAWQEMNWPLKDGVLRVGKGNVRAKEKLENFRLHVEFRVPYMPAESGQARGNSGVYLQGKYEVQVLDSFGLYPLQDNDCGGIYKVRAPRLNACLPPMQWQTYDITYVEGNPATKELPMVTIVQNGITIVEHARIPAELVATGTGGGDSSSGFLMLQDHGNPVEFRNIWAEPFFSTEKKRK